jgi:predicted metal-dependent hydrolase
MTNPELSNEFDVLYNNITSNQAPGLSELEKSVFLTQAQEVLVKRAETLKDETGLKYNGIKIGDFRAKWGSCDSNQEIKLNYKLVMLPHNVIDAVILHELVHTKEMSHSRNFYNKLIAVMPEYKKYRAVLKENNYLLKLY